LPFYAILRAVPNKLLGVAAMALSLIMLFLLPLSARPVSVDYASRDTTHSIFFFGLVFCYLMLGHLGAMPAEAPYVAMAQFFTFFYFVLFLVPLFGRSIFKFFRGLFARNRYH